MTRVLLLVVLLGLAGRAGAQPATPNARITVIQHSACTCASASDCATSGGTCTGGVCVGGDASKVLCTSSASCASGKTCLPTVYRKAAVLDFSGFVVTCPSDGNTCTIGIGPSMTAVGSCIAGNTGSVTQLCTGTVGFNNVDVDFGTATSVTLKNGSGYAPTTLGYFGRDNTAGTLVIGNGSTTDVFYPVTPSNDLLTQYVKGAGRSGGQTVKGGTAASENLTLNSTSNGTTKGSIVIDDAMGSSLASSTTLTSLWPSLDTTTGSITFRAIQLAPSLSALGNASKLYGLDVSPTFSGVGFVAATVSAVNFSPTITASASNILVNGYVLNAAPVFQTSTASSPPATFRGMNLTPTIKSTVVGAGTASGSFGVTASPTFTATTTTGASLTATSDIGLQHAPTYQSTVANGLLYITTRAAVSVTKPTVTTSGSPVGAVQVGANYGVDVPDQAAVGATIAALHSSQTTQAGGVVSAVASAPTAGGTGYTVGDVLTLTTGGGTAKVTVLTVSSGVVQTVGLTAGGTGYATGTGQATSGGTGTGCTINVTAIGSGAWVLLADSTAASSHKGPFRFGDNTQPASTSAIDIVGKTIFDNTTGILTTYNSFARDSSHNGAPFTVASATATAQGASISATNLIASATAGRYRMNCYVAITRAATTSAQLPNCNLICTDPTDSVAKTIQVTPATKTAAIDGVWTIVLSTNPTTALAASGSGICDAKAATAIQYSTANWASSGGTSMQYKVYVTLEAL